jgi:hypothetical protein
VRISTGLRALVVADLEGGSATGTILNDDLRMPS